MKRLKRLTALLLVPVMMFTFAPMAFAASGFTDVSPKDWFYAPVNWAVSKGITGGIGNGMFGPNNNCTREQVVTFLWADAGKPDPVTTVSPFVDVRESDWFFKPVMWAVENGITGGVTPTEFGAGKTCTRAQVATFLWAVAGKPSYDTPKKGFLDVTAGDWYYNSVMWAVSAGVTSGISAGKFGPNNSCTRAQIATFMYAASPDYVKPAPAPTPVPTATPKPTPEPISKEDRFEIAAAYVSEINSVEGVDMTIYWRNNTGRPLADIAFYVNVLDYNGNVLRNEIGGGTEFHCYLLNPPFPSGEGSSYYTGTKTNGKPDFSFLLYDEKLDQHYYTDWDLPYNDPNRTVYVSPADMGHQYVGSSWDAIMYNGRGNQIRINRVVLTYTDNTKETIRNPKVGPRTSPAEDRVYTQKLFDSLGCDVIGHNAKPTCTENAMCTRCYQIFPATGHTYSYSAICSDCGFRYEPDVTLVKRNFPETVYETDKMKHEYSFRVKNVYFDPERKPEVNCYSGEIEVSGWIYCTFAYESAATNIYPDTKTVYVDFVDENGKVVHTESFVAGSRETNVWFNVDFPGNGTYYVDVRYKEKPVKVCDRHSWGDDHLCTECGTRRVPENSLADPLDYIEIAAAKVNSVNDNGGVNTVIYWRNNTGKTISRIEFHKSILNKYGNVLSCDINNNTWENCFIERTITPENTAEGLISGYYFVGDDINLTAYDEKAQAQSYWRYYEDTDSYKLQFVHPDNQNHTYMAVYWNNIMSNPDAVSVRVDKVVVTFSDGSTATYYEPKVGPRNDLNKDEAYTAELKGVYGCEVFGHSYSDSLVCDDCGEAYVVDITLINTITPGVAQGTPGTLKAEDDAGRVYYLHINGVDVEQDMKAKPTLENGQPLIAMEWNIPYSFTAEDPNCEIPTYNIQLDVYDSEGMVVMTKYFNVYPDGTNKVLNVNLPGNDTYYIETHAEIFSAVA